MPSDKVFLRRMNSISMQRGSKQPLERYTTRAVEMDNWKIPYDAVEYNVLYRRKKNRFIETTDVVQSAEQTNVDKM